MDKLELLPSRVSERLYEALNELEEEIVEEARSEEEETSGQPCSYEEACEFVESWRSDIKSLIEGRTSWLIQESNEARDVAPAWFLDFQRELAEIDISRKWINGLELMVARLLGIEILILPDGVPEECRATMSQAALCYRYGLFRASVMLTRTAVEFALQQFMAERATLSGAVESAVEAGRLTPSAGTLAHSVRLTGNSAVHDDVVVDEENARGALLAGRVVLQDLYGGRVPQSRIGTM